MWENFEEMEEKLSMPELTAILEASRETTERSQRFAAALQGVDLSSGSDKTFTDIMLENMGSGDIETDIKNDVIQLNGAAAASAGFGIGLGLGYHVVDG